jgi:hypothetical protein
VNPKVLATWRKAQPVNGVHQKAFQAFGVVQAAAMIQWISSGVIALIAMAIHHARKPAAAKWLTVIRHGPIDGMFSAPHSSSSGNRSVICFRENSRKESLRRSKMAAARRRLAPAIEG